jgi:hypothetical protein
MHFPPTLGRWLASTMSFWYGAWLSACSPASPNQESDNSDQTIAGTSSSGTAKVNGSVPVTSSATSGPPSDPSTAPSSISSSSASSGPQPSSDPTTWPNVEPGVPQVLVSDLTYPARLALYDGRLIYPNRLGFPAATGGEELWQVSTHGGSGTRLGTLGTIYGFAQLGGELLIADNAANQLARVNLGEGTALGAVELRGPVQVAANSNAWFVSAVAGGTVSVSKFDATGSVSSLWMSNDSGSPLWLKATEDALYFSTGAGASSTYEIYALPVSGGDATLLLTSASEIGAIDVRDGILWYADHDAGVLGRIDLATRSQSQFANVPAAWSVLVDGDFVYVGSRPDWCETVTDGSIYRVALSDGTLESVADSLPCPSQMAADASGLYWVNNGVWNGDFMTNAAANGTITRLGRLDPK